MPWCENNYEWAGMGIELVMASLRLISPHSSGGMEENAKFKGRMLHVPNEIQTG
jgi:hypothetical protein